MLFTFTAPLWLWQDGSWHFITLPLETAAEIKFYTPSKRTGWGAVRISAKIGVTKWMTSIFPEKKSGSYVLPVKKIVRDAESLVIGQEVEVELWLDI